MAGSRGLATLVRVVFGSPELVEASRFGFALFPVILAEELADLTVDLVATELVDGVFETIAVQGKVFSGVVADAEGVAVPKAEGDDEPAHYR